jgi:hypothetical protein
MSTSKPNLIVSLNADEILSEFPKIELSYETMMHNKVHDSDIMCACPEGDKCFAWFTEYNDENVCFLFELEKKSKDRAIKIAVTSFNDSLVYGLGTILHGIIFKYNEVSCFCIQDMCYYKGSDMTGYSYFKRLQTMRICLERDLCSYALTNKFTIFGLPIISTNFGALLQDISSVLYKVDKIQFRYFNSKKIACVKYYKPNNNGTNNNGTNNNGTNNNGTNNNGTNNNGTNNNGTISKINKAIFKVSAQIQTDIYNLFVYKDGKEDFFSIAFIPDLKTSVLMNKLFRNIKENINLDALEESDEEVEFENEKEDKYVFLDRCVKMNCQYNHKFKKWTPISLAAMDSQVISLSLLV